MNKKILWYFLVGIIGIGLFVFTLFYNIEDSFWNSIAIGFIFSSLVRIYRVFKYKNNEEYARKIIIENNDERNKFLADKAKGIAFYFYIVISSYLIIILRIFEYKEMSTVLAYSICMLVFLYWIIYSVLKRKY